MPGMPPADLMQRLFPDMEFDEILRTLALELQNNPDAYKTYIALDPTLKSILDAALKYPVNAVKLDPMIQNFGKAAKENPDFFVTQPRPVQLDPFIRTAAINASANPDIYDTSYTTDKLTQKIINDAKKHI